jgi:hypothetical protein
VSGNKICGHCGRVMGDMAGGFASYNGIPLCHPNVDGRPDCYRNVSVYHHEVEDCLDGCRDDPYDRPPVFTGQSGVCEVPEILPGDERGSPLHRHS